MLESHGETVRYNEEEYGRNVLFNISRPTSRGEIKLRMAMRQ